MCEILASYFKCQTSLLGALLHYIHHIFNANISLFLLDKLNLVRWTQFYFLEQQTKYLCLKMATRYILHLFIFSCISTNKSFSPWMLLQFFCPSREAKRNSFPTKQISGEMRSIFFLHGETSEPPQQFSFNRDSFVKAFWIGVDPNTDQSRQDHWWMAEKVCFPLTFHNSFRKETVENCLYDERRGCV